MPRADQDLRNQLEQLSPKIKRTQQVDEKGKELLRQVEVEVH